MVAGPEVGEDSVEEGRVGTGNLPIWIQKYLTLEQAHQVSRVVHDAEKRTQGEIVPVIVRASAPLKSILMPSVLLFVAIFGFIELHYQPPFYPFSLVIAFALAFPAGYFFSRLHTVQRFFLADADEKKCVLERAELEFYRQGVHKTAEQTGVLIFISLLEHRVVILADRGISEVLPKDVWEEVVSDLVRSIHDRKLSEGLTRSIEKCAELLSRRFPRHSVDTNELKNDLVIKE